MVRLDLTGVDFVDSELVDFYDSKTIFFEPTNKLPETVTFKIWGADIERTAVQDEFIEVLDYPNISEALKKNGRLTVKGFSTLTFEEVVAGEIKISPYDKGEFVKLKNGTTQTFKREWNLDQIDRQCFCYHLNASIYFPYGACDLKLYTKGRVSFEFDPKNCINYLDYIGDKDRGETFWGYLKNKDICTSSLSYPDVDPRHVS
ncbi:hypothetical protein [Dawidia soli]|uniref:Uncharacterized protein n=1 Tax=Dawidia soli TaxID=2782352 RepID=A0AAP2DBF7_9BACT|nr:hypothetical protein [Dawidia soli]MBT1688859.1 hypothetical protein [Dawidia soli]